jgi:hypothetical protein
VKAKWSFRFPAALTTRLLKNLQSSPQWVLSRVSAGLDCTVALWDLRKLGDSRSRKTSSKAPEPIAQYNESEFIHPLFNKNNTCYIISSAIFYPTGSHGDFLLAT